MDYVFMSLVVSTASGIILASLAACMHQIALGTIIQTVYLPTPIKSFQET